jgi:hypothetical protein
MRVRISTVLISVVLFLAGCTAGGNPLANTPNHQGEIAGFFLGLWQGTIFPFAFLLSLLLEGVSVYEVHNSGISYNLGYLLGLAMIFESGSGAASRRRANRRCDDEDEEEDDDDC